MLKENPDEFWVRYLVGQFCVMRSVRPWEKLVNGSNWEAFCKKMCLSELVGQHELFEYLTNVFEEFKPTIYWKKAADRIARFVKNTDVVTNGKLILFDGLEGLDEDDRRSKLLERTRHFFKTKSISDLMIEIGMARDFIAFDTRIVGFLIDYLKLRLEPDVLGATEEEKRAKLIAKIQSDEVLYKKMERELLEICNDIGIPLGLLDRILFNSIKMSALQYVFKRNGYF